MSLIVPFALSVATPHCGKAAVAAALVFLIASELRFDTGFLNTDLLYSCPCLCCAKAGLKAAAKPIAKKIFFIN